jgi:hypothetical protein
MVNAYRIVDAMKSTSVSIERINIGVYYMITTHLIGFICNQGLSVRSGTNIWCMYSGAYYGNMCQDFSDRITIITHLNLSYTPYNEPRSSTLIIKIVAFLLFEKDEVIDLDEFHVRPLFQWLNHTKYKFYLIYSRSDRFLKHNNDKTLIDQILSIIIRTSFDFKAFELQHNNTVEL